MEKNTKICEIVNIGIAGNTAQENRVAKSIGHSKECKLIRDEEGRVLLSIIPEKGNCLIVEFENDEDMINNIEKILLNIENARENGEIVITSNSDRTRKITDNDLKLFPRITMLNNKEIKEKISQMCKVIDITEQEIIDWIEDEFLEWNPNSKYDIANFANAVYHACGYRPRLLEEQKESIKTLCADMETVLETKKQCSICSPNQILINGKTMQPIREVADSLIEKAVVQGESSNSKLLDFSNTGYAEGIQEYLLKHLYGIEIGVTSEQLEAIKYYKQDGFKFINNFMRGNFEELDELNITQEELVKRILTIDKLGKMLPTRNYDIVLSRLGSSHNKGKNVGDINTYDSFVSFGTNGGTSMGGIMPTTRYKKTLKRDEPAIPIEQLYSLDGHFPECEIITLPFSYSVLDVSDKKADRGIQNIVIGEEQPLSVEEILLSRLNSYEQFQVLKMNEQGADREQIEIVIADIRKAIEAVTKFNENSNSEQLNITPLKYFDDKSAKEEINAKDLISQVVEGKNNQPRLSTIKQVASKIRNKFKQITQTYGKDENGNDR